MRKKATTRLFITTLFLLGMATGSVWAGNTDADNTGKNVRDKNGATVTPMDQSEKEADVMLTQKIRQAVVADDSLSTNAKNVKIVTIDGAVTLRGPVDSVAERTRIEQLARQIAGPKNVTNQIELNKQ